MSARRPIALPRSGHHLDDGKARRPLAEVIYVAPLPEDNRVREEVVAFLIAILRRPDGGRTR